MNTPANIIRLLDNGSLKDVLELQRHNTAHMLAKLHVPLTPTEIEEIVTYLDEEIGICLSPVQVERLFNLYPEYRVRIIDAGMDTEAREAVSGAVAKFFLNCKWPAYGDGIDFNKFNAALQHAVPLMRPLL